MTVVRSVGVMLRPRTVDDVLRVHHDDAGAYSEGGANFSLGEPLSAASFDSSLERVEPGRYNEWRVRGAEPVGLFVVDPASIEVRQRVTLGMPGGSVETTGPIFITLDRLRAIFPGQSIWTMAADGPTQI